MSLPFTQTELLLAVVDGRVTARPHPTLPYTIFNYSPEVQFTKHWDRVTMACRGLILDKDFNIVARPWEKFFNLGEVNLPMQFTDPVEIMDKADGSLGILYPTGVSAIDGDNKWAIATRGSFASEQAIHATLVWKKEYEEYYNDVAEAEVLKDYTPLFEIIYPENRIVLDYKEMDDLILLGGVEKEHGYYVGPRAMSNMIAWPGPVVETFEYNTITDALSYMDRKNAEGYVIRSHNFLVKLKQPDYIDLHRLVTNASPKTVWEQLKAGKSKSEIVSAFPDEFHDYIASMIDPLVEAFDERLSHVLMSWQLAQSTAFERFGIVPSRAEWASVIKKSKDARFLFLLLDDKNIRDVLWAELRPRQTFPEVDDDVDAERLTEARA